LWKIVAEFIGADRFRLLESMQALNI